MTALLSMPTRESNGTCKTGMSILSLTVPAITTPLFGDGNRCKVGTDTSPKPSIVHGVINMMLKNDANTPPGIQPAAARRVPPPDETLSRLLRPSRVRVRVLRCVIVLE